MKAITLQEDLAKGLVMVSRVVASRGQLPVLANILVEGTKEGVNLVATNLELGMRVAVGGRVEEEGAITVPARQLVEFVAAMETGNVKLGTEAEKMSVVGSGSRGMFAGIAASEFPTLPRPGETKSGKVKIDKKTILEIAAQVAYAAAGDESRPVLTGVKFSVAGEQLTVVATDGFRLSRKAISSGKGGEQFKDGLILPARTILELARVAGEAEGNGEIEMEVVKANNQVVFSLGRIELVSRVLEGNFPDTEKIIPREFKTSMVADRGEWTRLLRAAGIFARDNSNIVRFKVADAVFKMSASAAQVGENESEMEAEVEGEGGEIAFNYKYVLDFLGSVEGERVCFKMNDNLSPGVFGVEKDESLTVLVMPVRV